MTKPNISFSISKDGGSYHGNVTCCSARGSPPVNFSLSLDHNVVGSVTLTESLTASFLIEIRPGVDMGVARCRVKTAVQELTSEPVALLVGKNYTDLCRKHTFLQSSMFSYPLQLSFSHSAPPIFSSPSWRGCKSGG